MSKVYLVGAGPGDPELLTLKGRRVLGIADVVLYDHLANVALLDFAPTSAERVYVGKKRAEHACSQTEIISLAIAHAQAGRTVVRLKGGDPFIFGRGGEEIQAIAAAGIGYEVVPGVTAPLGIAAYAGVPLTHREHTSVVTFVTGHHPESIDWSSVAQAETLVIFMGLQHLDEIALALIEAGREGSTPAIAVEWGTTPRQRTVVGTLSDLGRRVNEARLHPPATVIVGAVVGTRDELSWFEKLPLFGKTVVVTRAKAQSGELVAALRELGAEVVELPVIEMAEVENDSALQGCLGQLENYEWVVFTSTNAVDFFFRKLTDVRRLQARVCAVGEATRAALAAYRVGVDLVPEEHNAEGVARAFGAMNMEGVRVLFPRAAAGREVIPQALSAQGALVDAPAVYRNIVPKDAQLRMEKWLASGGRADWMVFASPSAVKNFLTLGGRESALRARIASIGPTSSEAVRMHELGVAVEAEEPSVGGLVAAIIRASD